jgi:hypothetical protein
MSSNPSTSKNKLIKKEENLNKYKKSEITCYILSAHDGIKLDINSKNNYRKYINTWMLVSMCLRILSHHFILGMKPT